MCIRDRRWRPPVREPLAAVRNGALTDGAFVRLQELADAGRLRLEAQVAELGAGGRRRGPFWTTKG
eukprot:1904150-Alexandrium_andersonii.AAC.1